MKPKRTLHIVFTLSLILGLYTSLAGQEAEKGSDTTLPSTQDMKARLDRLLQAQPEVGQGEDENSTKPVDARVSEPTMPVGPPEFLSDPATNEKYLAALREYYTYRIEGLQHRSDVFEWQLFSSKLIFVAVLALVLAGIYFAAVQFHTGLVRKGKANVAESEERTELVASVKGVKVSSPVLGVVILVISLAFFYLYLVYVYPIQEIF